MSHFFTLMLSKCCQLFSCFCTHPDKVIQHILRQNTSVCIVDNFKKFCYAYLEGSCVGSRRKAVSRFPCGRQAAFAAFSKPPTDCGGIVGGKFHPKPLAEPSGSKKAYGDDKNKTKEEKILHLHEVSG